MRGKVALKDKEFSFEIIQWDSLRSFVDFYLSNKEIHIWIVPFLDSPYNELNKFLSIQEKLKAASFHTILLENNYITGRGFLRSLLGLYLGLDPSILKFKTNSWGKPLLEKTQNHLSSSCLPIAFNLSHSKDFLIYAVTCCASKIGVDLENLNSSMELDPYLISYCLNQEEQNSFYNLPRHKLLPTYLYIWTLKEAVLKALGFGLSFPLCNLTVALPPSDYAQVSIKGSASLDGWFCYSFHPLAGYIGALATNHMNPQLKIFKVGW